MAPEKLHPPSSSRYRHGLILLASFTLLLSLACSGCASRHTASSTGEQSIAQSHPAPARPEQPLFVFATIADSHIISTLFDDHRYLKALSISRELLTAVVMDINAYRPKVDFVVHLGDITDFGRATEFDNAKRILGKLRCPLFPVVGNHDNFMSDNKRGWKKFAGRDSTAYAFDYKGFHFIVIDCTPNPYTPSKIGCDAALREWVRQNLAANHDKPTILFSHYNLVERYWNAVFDTVSHYPEYAGMADLRATLEEAGNVIAVINGHVHANRVEIINGIYYIDIGATLVGIPSIRYFHVYPSRIEVTYEYISDIDLRQHVASLCRECCCCFDRNRVCDFIDGHPEDKTFAIAFSRRMLRKLGVQGFEENPIHEDSQQ